MRLQRLASVLAAALALSAAPALAQGASDIAAKAAVCGACHGANGVPANKAYPAIWGQQAGYIFIELRDYQTGARKNPIMAGIVKGMSHSEMLALGEYFAAKPWPDLQQPKAPADVTAKAEAVATSGQCTQCHLGGYLGAGTTPRLAGQSADYLRQTMRAFHDGTRGNNPWMSALLKTYSDADLDVLARYLAGL